MTKMTDLERDIEESRARLDRTIDRLQDRMTASGVADDVLGTARRHGYGPTLDRAAATIRDNPIPVLLIAAGIGWLALSMTETARRREARRDLERRGVWDRPDRRPVESEGRLHQTDAGHDTHLDAGVGRSPTDPDIVAGGATYRPSVTPERPEPYAPVTGTTSGVRR